MKTARSTWNAHVTRGTYGNVRSLLQSRRYDKGLNTCSKNNKDIQMVNNMQDILLLGRLLYSVSHTYPIIHHPQDRYGYPEQCNVHYLSPVTLINAILVNYHSKIITLALQW